jgi:NhaA family Na+:H+ antiporter
MTLTKLFNEFFASEKAGGFILIIATILSLVLANSPISQQYATFWNSIFWNHSLLHWINDGLMTLFFLLIGLELEREIYEGELSSLKKASLPIFAALGGMIFPASIYLLVNINSSYAPGAGIPTATDIAFAVGILSILGNRVPGSLKIFLTALAVIDDLGAIIIISVFYTRSLSFLYLGLAFGVFILMIVLNRTKVYNLLPYIGGGIIMWFLMQKSGIHPSISGVLLAFAIPFGDGGERSPSFRMQHLLHIPVAIIVLPLFALANTAITLDKSYLQDLTESYSTGIIAGLIAGKSIGISLLSYIAIKLGISEMPSDINWKAIFGIGLLGGIGFTMSIFITLLAFENEAVINTAKTSILIGSAVAGISGYFWLKSILKLPTE